MITIRRNGGDRSQEWTFDGWFLAPSRQPYAALIFDGNDLLRLPPDLVRRWQFDGKTIDPICQQDGLWKLEDRALFRPAAPSEPRWYFDGVTLAQETDFRPDRWTATKEVPLLVMAYAAGLI